MGETTAVFVHGGDVNYSVARHVTGDLDVPDEAAVQLTKIGPSQAVIGGIADTQGTTTNSEVVPGNVHPPVERRGWIIVGPTRFTVGRGLVINAEMGPTGRRRIPWGGGF